MFSKFLLVRLFALPLIVLLVWLMTRFCSHKLLLSLHLLITSGGTGGGAHNDHNNNSNHQVLPTLPITHNISSNLTHDGVAQQAAAASAVTLTLLNLTQSIYQTRSFILSNQLVALSFVVPASTAYCFAQFRNLYYEESSRLQLYNGPMWISSQLLASLPFSIAQTALTSMFLPWAFSFRQSTSIDQHQLLSSTTSTMTASTMIVSFFDRTTFIIACMLLFVHVFLEQITLSVMCWLRSPYKVSTLVSTLALLMAVAATPQTVGALNSHNNWPLAKWPLNYANIHYYANYVLHYVEFINNPAYNYLPSFPGGTITRQSNMGGQQPPMLPEQGADFHVPTTCQSVMPGRCLFVNGTNFMSTFYAEGLPLQLQQFELTYVFWRNCLLTFLLACAMFVTNILIYVLPVPASVKSKFRQ